MNNLLVKNNSWHVPPNLKFCLNSGLRYILKDSHGNKKVFTSYEIKQLLEGTSCAPVPPPPSSKIPKYKTDRSPNLIACGYDPSAESSDGKYGELTPNCNFDKYTGGFLQMINSNWKLSMSIEVCPTMSIEVCPTITFNKLVTDAHTTEGVNDINITLCNINRNKYIYYKGSSWKGGTKNSAGTNMDNPFFDKENGWGQGGDIWSSDMKQYNALNFTAIGWNKNIYLYTIIFNPPVPSLPLALSTCHIRIEYSDKNNKSTYNSLKTLALSDQGINLTDILQYYTIHVDDILITDEPKTWSASGDFFVPIPNLQVKEASKIYTMQYFGALSSSYYENKDIHITIADNVWLPFGFSQSYQRRELNLKGPLPKGIVEGRYLFLKNELSVTNKDVYAPLSSKEIISSTAKSISITGGVISGHFMCEGGDKPSLFPGYAPSHSQVNGSCSTDPYTYRADCATRPQQQQILSAIQYWIFAGLLEFNTFPAGTINITNTSVLSGRARGISAVQLNAYNVNTPTTLSYFGVESNELNDIVVLDEDNTSIATISNSQFVCNWEGQADGLDSKCGHTHIENCVIQAIDDCLKIAGNMTANNNTILSGNTGGAINIGAYGYNNPINSASINYTWIHLLDKKPPPFLPYTPESRTVFEGSETSWPWTAGVIFMPQYPTKHNKITKIKIDNLYYTADPNDPYYWNTDSSLNYFFIGGWVDAGFTSETQYSNFQPNPSANIEINPSKGFSFNPWNIALFTNIKEISCNNSDDDNCGPTNFNLKGQLCGQYDVRNCANHNPINFNLKCNTFGTSGYKQCPDHDQSKYLTPIRPCPK